MDQNKFWQIMEGVCPSELQEDWDNTGWQIRLEKPVKKVLTTLEVTDAVITEAEETGADMIVAHHPLIFTSISSVDLADPAGRMIARLVRDGISVISCHTSFDKMPGGNNENLGQVLGFHDVRLTGGDGYLWTGKLEKAEKFGDFCGRAASVLGISREEIHTVGSLEDPILTAGWCTGSGGEFLKEACGLGLDLYITGDFKYHDAQYAKAMGIHAMDAGHFGTENIFAANMKRLLGEALQQAGEDVIVRKSEIDIDPFI